MTIYLSLPVIVGKSERHTKFAGKSKHCCGGSGGGSQGGPVASFTRTTSNHSSLQRHAPRHGPIPGPQSHAVGTDQCTIFRIVATVIDYFSLSLLVTACHRLFTYHCLAPVLAGKNEHRHVLFAGKSEHHLDLVNTCFTPTNFYARVTGQSTSGSARMRLPFPSRTNERTHERTQPIVSIDNAISGCRHVVEESCLGVTEAYYIWHMHVTFDLSLACTVTQRPRETIWL